jgi:hypothetical protein
LKSSEKHSKALKRFEKLYKNFSSEFDEWFKIFLIVGFIRV